MDHSLKTKKEYKILKKTVDSRYIYQNEIDKACFQHCMTYGDFGDLSGITASDKVLHDIASYIAKNSKYDRHQRGAVSVVYKFFDETLLVVVLKIKIYKTKN